MKDIKEELLKNGFADSFPYSNYNMVRYTAKNGNKFDIYLDDAKPNRVETLRGHKPGVFSAFGLIGNFVGGKGTNRKFSFKTPEDLKNKLDNWKL
jgi:hypothetical protein